MESVRTLDHTLVTDEYRTSTTVNDPRADIFEWIQLRGFLVN